MTKKHKLEKFFSSIIQNHVETDSEELENREEIQKNVEKILKLARSEDHELVSLIKDFSKGYQTLCGRYDHLVGKLKKNVRPKRDDNGSFSFNIKSSDSDSSSSEGSSDEERSYKVRGNKAGKKISLEDYQGLQEQFESVKIRNNELETLAVRVADREAVIMKLQNELETMRQNVEVMQAENEVLRIESETSSKQHYEMNQRIGNMYDENEALRSENIAAFNRIQEAEKSIEEWKLELDQLKEELLNVRSENSFLKKEMEKSLEHAADLSQHLTTTNREKEALRSLNFTLLSRTQEAEKALAGLRVLNANLSSENRGLKLSLEALDTKGTDLIQKLKTAEEENSNLKSEIQEIEKVLAGLRDENANMLSENRDLKLSLAALDAKGADLIQKLKTAEEENSNMKSEIIRLTSRVQEAEENIKDLTTESGLLKDENLTLLDINNELSQQLKAKDDENSSLTQKHSETVEMFQQGQENLTMLSVEVGKMKDENSQLLVNYENLKLELEAKNEVVSELKQTLEETQGEKHALTEETSELLSKINQAEKLIVDLKAKGEQLGINKSQLEVKVDDLGRELQTTTLQLTDLEKALGMAEEEKDSLVSENSRVISKLEQAEANAKELETELRQSREENSVMQVRVQEAEKTIDDISSEREQLIAGKSQLQIKLSELTVELEVANLKLSDLNKVIGVTEEEKGLLAAEMSTMSGKLQQVEIIVKELENELEQLKEENSMLKQIQNHLQNQISDFERRLDDKTAEISSLQEELDRSSENQMLMKKVEDELTSKLSSQESMLKDQMDSFNSLLANHKKLEDENEIKEETIRMMDTFNENLKKELDRLEEGIQDLAELREAEKIDADKEIARLLGQVQTLEVQIRLSNQKLKITEEENTVKEERYKRTVAVLQDERKVIEEQMLRMCGKTDLLETELRKMKEVAEARVVALSDGFRKLEMVFEENSTHAEMQLSECTEELKVVKAWLGELKNEQQQLSERMKYKEGIISMLKDERGSMQAKFAEMEKRLLESETKVKLLQMEVSGKEEEKREAIRQLCLLIEYHRENCNHLYKYLTSILKRGRRSA